MFDKVLDIIKNRDFVVSKLLLTNYKNLNITEKEVILIIYLMNQNNNIYNPKNLSDDLKWELIDVLTSISELTDKGIISITIEDKDNVKAEIFSLNPLYEKLAFSIIDKEEEKTETTIYSTIENEFARSLTPLEYDLINAWLDNGYTEELIKEALKEAIYNNVTSLKYIDKILDNWHKKGIKTKEDVSNNKKKFRERKQVKKDPVEYDWLNED